MLSTQTVSASANAILIRGALVFDGVKLIGHRDVLLDEGHIKQISRHISPAPGMQTIDGRGRMLLPGLIDGHAHTFPGAQKDALRFGVTTVFDMYSLADPSTIAGWRRQRSAFDEVNHADTFTAGIGATPPGGHPTELFKDMPAEMSPPPTLADDADAKLFMKARVAARSDYIKILQDDGARPGRPASFPAFSAQRFKQVIQAAKSTGERVVVHVQNWRTLVSPSMAGRMLSNTLSAMPPWMPKSSLRSSRRGLLKRRRWMSMTA
jgi:predicted amidohydrolase YtcJ